MGDIEVSSIKNTSYFKRSRAYSTDIKQICYTYVSGVYLAAFYLGGLSTILYRYCFCDFEIDTLMNIKKWEI